MLYADNLLGLCVGDVRHIITDICSAANSSNVPMVDNHLFKYAHCSNFKKASRFVQIFLHSIVAQ